MSSRRIAVLTAAVLWASLAAWAATWVYGLGIPVEELPAALRESLGASPWALPALLGLFVVRPFIFLPLWALALAAGLLFGPLGGTAASLVGNNLSAATTYGVARALRRGRPLPRRRLFTVLDARLREYPFLAVLLLRFVYLPFDTLSIVAGFTRVRFSSFLGATILAGLPALTAYGVLGGSMTRERVLPFVAGFVLLVAVGSLLIRRTAVGRRVLRGVDEAEENAQPGFRMRVSRRCSLRTPQGG